MEELTPGIYEHFKGNRYFALGAARYPYLSARLAVYRALYGERLLFLRPLNMFLETVERDGATKKRFERIEGQLDPYLLLQLTGMLCYDDPFLPAFHSETREKFAVYRGLFGEQDLIARPFADLVHMMETFRFKL